MWPRAVVGKRPLQMIHCKQCARKLCPLFVRICFLNCPNGGEPYVQALAACLCSLSVMS